MVSFNNHIKTNVGDILSRSNVLYCTWYVYLFSNSVGISGWSRDYSSTEVIMVMCFLCHAHWRAWSSEVARGVMVST